MATQKIKVNAEVGITAHSAISIRLDIDTLSVDTRRELFSLLLRDPVVVTAKPFSTEHIALFSAADAACNWGKK